MSKYKKLKRDKKNSNRIFLIINGTILAVLIVSLIQMYVKTDVSKINEEIKAEKTSRSVNEMLNSDKLVEDIIEETNHSIVGISTLKDAGTSIFTQDGVQKLGLGTGFIASENGYIITNKHVSGDKYSNCYVTLENGNTYDGKVVWADSKMDLSIVKINLFGLKTIKLGDSNIVKSGQEVYAIGNPIGYEFQRTVTSGIISAKSRTIKFTENNEEVLMTDLIQTDATINPGNSGGPLINNRGEVIGVNSIKINSAEGMGLAVPINVLKPIINKYSQTGNFEETTIGVSGYDKNVVQYINKNIKLDSGVYVENITKGSPAELYGIKEGDIILKIDNKKIYTINDIKEYIYTKSPGENINIEYKRGNLVNTMELALAKK